MGLPTPVALISWLTENLFLTPVQAEELRCLAFTDMPSLVRELVKRNWLTPYQANQVLQGRGDILILGPYQLLERLGEGSMGQVFKGRHASLGRLVALKIIHRHNVASPKTVERFKREGRTAASLAHPNIVAAYDANDIGGRYFLAMEFIEGTDLAKIVKKSGPLPVGQACEYVRQAALGLQHAFERAVVHRDIKPGNLLVTRTPPGTPPQVKILDFGLARFESEYTASGRLTQTGTLLGTVDFMAPEQIENAQAVDVRADIFSLGCTLYYLLTGRPPFGGDTLVEKVSMRLIGQPPQVRALRPEVPVDLEDVLLKMMARDPVWRFQTPNEVAAALQAFLALPPAWGPAQVPPGSTSPLLARPVVLPTNPWAPPAMPAAPPAPPLAVPVKPSAPTALRMGPAPAQTATAIRMGPAPAPLAAPLGPIALPLAAPLTAHLPPAPAGDWAPPAEANPFLNLQLESSGPPLATAVPVGAAPSPFGSLAEAPPDAFPMAEATVAEPERMRKPPRPQPATNRTMLLIVGGILAGLAALTILLLLLIGKNQPTGSANDRYPNPDAYIRVKPITSDIVLKKNRLVRVRVTVERHGFRGKVFIHFEQMPEGISSPTEKEPTVIPEDRDFADVKMSASQWAVPGRAQVHVLGRSKNLRSQPSGAAVVVEKD